MADSRDCLQSLRSAAVAFRLGMEAQGNEAFVGFVDRLAPLLADPERAQAAGEIGPFLPEIVAAQQRGDFLRVADLLEYEVGPRL